jgi:LytS/YehU family sensor histidine kinase
MILLLLLLAYSVFRWQLKKTKRENQLILDKINLEKDLNESKLIAIKSQMNPHFFYNALNTIQSFILSNDKKQALTYLAKFSALTRKILVMTEKENISIAEEVKTLKLYLDIEKARFEENFNYEINISENIDSENTKIPSMLLQVYIENALKHGLLHKKGLKYLEIKFSENQENILIEIIDNGIGREKSSALNAIKKKNHTSFATRAMKNRIDLLNSNKKEKMKIEIIDVYNQKDQSSGTKVSIKIPINF